MRDAATILTKLLDVAEAVVTVRVRNSDLSLSVVCDEVLDAAAGPVPEGGRLVEARAVHLANTLTFLRDYQKVGDREGERLMRQLAGMLLPDVREQLAKAIAWRHRAPSP